MINPIKGRSAAHCSLTGSIAIDFFWTDGKDYIPMCDAHNRFGSIAPDAGRGILSETRVLRHKPVDKMTLERISRQIPHASGQALEITDEVSVLSIFRTEWGILSTTCNPERREESSPPFVIPNAIWNPLKDILVEVHPWTQPYILPLNRQAYTLLLRIFSFFIYMEQNR